MSLAWRGRNSQFKSGSQLRPIAFIKLGTNVPDGFAVTSLMYLQLFLIQCARHTQQRSAVVYIGHPQQNAQVDYDT